MVKVKEKFPPRDDDTVDIEAWLHHLQTHYAITHLDLIKNAYQLAETHGKGLTTFYGQPCLEQGLEMAEIILELKLDATAVASSIIVSVAQQTPIPPEDIVKHLGQAVADLVNSVLQMNIFSTLTDLRTSRDPAQLDRLRKIVLAMVSDIRAVVIKLAERTALIRGIKPINRGLRKQLAQETMDIYAPLANRLGMGQLKWELEDLSFHYLDPETYKTIASFIAEKRIDREKRIQDTIRELKEALKKAHVTAEVTGRAKHIYSIYLKSKRKQLDYKSIYDYSAVRILVPTIEDCYTALSIVHRLWDQLPDEFDDYIAKPKPNGYRSIHTAVIGPQDKTLEIQIRTYEMHEQSEHGVAAHWMYKENKKLGGYEEKITFLRQLLAWQSDITGTEPTEQNAAKLFSDRVYVFTPGGEVIDLTAGATPLDFAYHIHSELGHRCRGAKVNGQIVPLNYRLQTGDQIEVLSIPQGDPSRDWLNRELGYLTTSRARAKVGQWFRAHESILYTATGKEALEKELARLNLQHVNLNQVANRLNFKNESALFTSLGHGSIRINQIIQAIHTEQKKENEQNNAFTVTPKKSPQPIAGLEIAGIHDLMTRVARCCKPIPGDEIVGFITQGRGVSIHRQDCYNVTHLNLENQNRLLAVSWDHKTISAYYVDLYIEAQGREHCLKNLTSLFANLKVSVIALNSMINKKTNRLTIYTTVEIHDAGQLNQLIHAIKELPFIIEAKRNK